MLPSGKMGSYYYHHSEGGVFIVPVLQGGNVLLLRQYRYLLGRESIEFPGGGVGRGEIPRVAAVRELKEETGFSARVTKKIGGFCPYNGVTNEWTSVFLASGLSRGAHSREEAEQDIRTIECSPGKVDRLIASGKIFDGQSIVAWEFAKKYMKNRKSVE